MALSNFTSNWPPFQPTKMKGYKRSQTILSKCEPVVKCITPEYEHLYCARCWATDKTLIPCESCNLVHYCNDICRNQDMLDGHSVECPSRCYREFCREENTAHYKLLTFRLFAKIKLGHDFAKKPHELHDGNSICFQDLLDEQKIKRKKEKILNIALSMTEGMRKDGIEVKFELLQGLLGTMMKNCLFLDGSQGRIRIGNGIYIAPSVFQHSCKPTAFYNNRGPIVEVRAITDIREGQEPTVTYDWRYKDRTERRKRLLYEMDISCFCERCQTEDGPAVDYNELTDMISRMHSAHMGILPLPGWSKLYKMNKKILEMLRKLFYPYDPRISHQLARLLYIAVDKNVNPYKLRNLHKKARKHLRITYGKDSEDYKFYMNLLGPYPKNRLRY